MINFLCERIFGPFLPVFLICAGIFLTFRLRGTLLRRPAGIIRSIFIRAEKNEKSPFIAVALSLAGTLGVGNITGVAAAIKAGGPGAVFWMWAAALAAMPVRYSEIVLSVKFCKTEAGAADYIRLTGKAPTAAAFSALCVAASFTIGNTVQVNAAAEAVSYMLPSLPPNLSLSLTPKVFGTAESSSASSSSGYSCDAGKAATNGVCPLSLCAESKPLLAKYSHS